MVSMSKGGGEAQSRRQHLSLTLASQKITPTFVYSVLLDGVSRTGLAPVIWSFLNLAVRTRAFAAVALILGPAL